MNNKYKIYLDTSIISYIKQEDTPLKMADTIEFFQKVKLGFYDIYVSELCLRELDGCSEEKFNYIMDYISDINYKYLSMTLEAEELANKYIEEGILTEKSINDAKHIALATVNRLDIISSWNFKHMVNPKTILGVQKINYSEKYSSIEIFTPSILINGGENNE